MMKTLAAFVMLGAALLLAGCVSRSISDSGYRNRYGWGRSSTPSYQGELTELDILGAALVQEATEENIQKALASDLTPRLKRGDPVLLIQSGAFVPDNAMLEEAARYLQVAPFSGIPPTDKTGLADSLRLRAAQGGYRYILCYWGVLESAYEEKEGTAVSWVPILGGFVPDQRQQMRIRLKGLVLDVASGGWKMVTPEATSDTNMSSGRSRESADQRLVESLKQQGYRSLVNAVLM